MRLATRPTSVSIGTEGPDYKVKLLEMSSEDRSIRPDSVLKLPNVRPGGDGGLTYRLAL